MKRLAAVLAGTAGLAALIGTQTAVAAPVSGPEFTGVITCGSPGAPGFLLTKACIEVTGNQVNLYGHAAPTSPGWQDQQVRFKLSGAVIGSPPFGGVNPTTLVTAGGNYVSGITTTAPCGATVTVEFSVDQWGWPPSTATASTVVSC
ncbi:hypothetical protein [Kitasatospora sp. NPDC088351]|uniref:hypothetical protein n=1 Tax=unclassified Kitasatospora TaxID=2633591 RepID=UPI003427099B